jgi:hypothetical protein
LLSILYGGPISKAGREWWYVVAPSVSGGCVAETIIAASRILLRLCSLFAFCVRTGVTVLVDRVVSLFAFVARNGGV